MRRRRAESATSRILIRLPNWVGDILMALPAVQALRAHKPDAHLVAMARPEHLELVRRVAAFDEVVPAPPPRGSGRRQAWWRAVRALRSRKLHAAVLLAPSFESAMTALVAGIPLRVGHATDRRSWLLTHRIRTAPEKHRTDGFLDLVAVLGATPVSGRIPFSFQSDERQFVEQLFAEEGLAEDDRPVLINPAAAKTARAWSADRFRQLAETIASQHGGTTVLVHLHPPFDVPEGWPEHPSIHLVKGATLLQLGAVIERCRLYVGNDSGPMHIAAAVGLPTVGVYGPSSPDHTSPRGSTQAPHLAVSAFFACSPCRERFFEECPSPPTRDGRPPCLDAVSVETVAQQVDRLLVSPD